MNCSEKWSLFILPWCCIQMQNKKRKSKCDKILACILRPVLLYATPWNVGLQAPLSMGFSRQEYCSGLPFPPPGDLPDPGIEPASPTLAGRFFTTVPPRKAITMTKDQSFVWPKLNVLRVVFFFLIFFDVDHFLSLYWISYNIVSVLCLGFFFGPEAYGTLTLQPAMETAPLALEGEVLTTGSPWESQECSLSHQPGSF